MTGWQKYNAIKNRKRSFFGRKIGANFKCVFRKKINNPPKFLLVDSMQIQAEYR
jgi:hypothetical protein